MRERPELERFESIIMPHLAAGYNLARWLTRNDADAEDVVQEAYLRAFRSFAGYRGGDPRAWLLTIVRNTCYTWLRQQRGLDAIRTWDNADGTGVEIPADPCDEPEAAFNRSTDRRLLQEAIQELPVEFREAFVLRELEGFSYKEIAEIADVALGTVMSRLARARQQLQRNLARRLKDKG